jgi:hypothetical protein
LIQPTHVTEASRHAEAGRITPEQAQMLDTPVVWGRDTMTLAEAFDKAAVEAGSDERGSEIAVGLLQKLKTVDGRPLPRAARMVLKTWDTVSRVAKEGIQYNVVTGARGSIGDAIGDGFSMLVTGHEEPALRSLAAPIVGLGEVIRAKITGNETGNIIRHLRAVQSANPELLNDLPEFAPMREMGMTLPREYQPRVAVMRDDAAMTGEMTIHRGAMSVTGGRGKKPIGAVTGVFANKALKDFRTALESERRISLYIDQSRSGIGGALDRFSTVLDEQAAKAGTTGEDLATRHHERSAATRPQRRSAVVRWLQSPRTWGGDREHDLSRKWRTELNDSMRRQARK